jgi:hypothetical protein
MLSCLVVSSRTVYKINTIRFGFAKFLKLPTEIYAILKVPTYKPVVDLFFIQFRTKFRCLQGPWRAFLELNLGLVYLKKALET